jgi:N-acyl-D-amino-acid deacylase
VVRPGAFADLTVFDPAAVIDRSTYADPFHYSEGIVYVIVNGTLVLDGGKPTGARPGRAVRRADSSPPSPPRGGGPPDKYNSPP